jgi:hypothetical protein
MDRRADIVGKAREGQFRRAAPAAYGGGAFEDLDGDAGASERDRSRKSIGPSSDNDGVGPSRQDPLTASRAAPNSATTWKD